MAPFGRICHAHRCKRGVVSRTRRVSVEKLCKALKRPERAQEGLTCDGGNPLFCNTYVVRLILFEISAWIKRVILEASRSLDQLYGSDRGRGGICRGLPRLCTGVKFPRDELNHREVSKSASKAD